MKTTDQQQTETAAAAASKTTRDETNATGWSSEEGSDEEKYYQPPPPPQASSSMQHPSPEKHAPPQTAAAHSSPRNKRKPSSTSSPSSTTFTKVSPVAHLTGREPFPVNRALPQPHIPSLIPPNHEEEDDEEEEDEVEHGHHHDDHHEEVHHNPIRHQTTTTATSNQRQMSPTSTGKPPLNNNNTTNHATTTNTGNSSHAHHSPTHPTLYASSFMSVEDLEICQRLDLEYERALEEREIAYNARFHSVRQSAVGSIFFMLFFLCLATFFYRHQTHWTTSECLLFSVYTITTVGYGSLSIPKTAPFQLYTICFIFIGIATLTIMVAQIYQCIALEASRAQHSRDQSEMARRGLDILTNSNIQQRQQRQLHDPEHHGASQAVPTSEQQHNDNAVVDEMMEISSTAWDRWNQYYSRSKVFFQTSELGRGISVIFPFAGLIFMGAIVVGPIEGWTPLEALYFAVVSLTTVGFGDSVPTKGASIWFCIFWLPFSVGFMSLFLGNIANFYLRLSDQNIQRIERQLRRRLRNAKERAEQERIQALRRAHRGQDGGGGGGGGGVAGGAVERMHMAAAEDDDEQNERAVVVAAVARRNRVAPEGFDVLPMQDGEDELTESEQAARHQAALFGSPNSDSGGGLRRRERILYSSIYAPISPSKQQQVDHQHRDDQNGNGDTARPRGQTMATMRDVLRRVRINLARTDGTSSSPPSASGTAVVTDPESEFMSRRSTTPMTTASFSATTAVASLTQPHGNYSLKPSFALRVLVQERMAEIIAIDIAGFQSSIEIKDNTLSVSIETLKLTADKWLIPRRARKAFRAVAFEALYFVGEHGLITRGADALYDLTPFEFHGLFNPLLAAMGDAEMMEAWLASTEVLAEVDLKRDLSSSSISSSRYSITAPTSRVRTRLESMMQGRNQRDTEASQLPEVS